MIEQLHLVIQKIEQEWPEKRLLVLGDVMLDKYIWGEVGRISPEAPVPVVRATHRSEQPGGAANVAMNMAKLGASVVVVGFTGGDEDERLVAESLRSNGIDPAFVSCEDFPTITKLRILGGRQQMLRLDSERLGAHAEADHERLLHQGRRTSAMPCGCAFGLCQGRAGAKSLPGGDYGGPATGHSGAG